MAGKGTFDMFTRFNKQFWVVNTFELFERGAYYGMMSIFAFHFIYNIGISDVIVGLALGVLMPLLYFMPLVAATLAEKYGYKPAFVISFVMIIVGYVMLYMTNGMMALFASVIALGIGAGSFKPMVSATIAHVTPHEDRNYGYSIYYWMINLGAALFPFIIGYYIEGVLGDTALYNLAFLISSATIGLNLVTCFLMFKEPVEPRSDRTILKAFKDLALVMKDRTFVVLLLTYSGFWFMFSLNQSFLPVYLIDFGLKPEWFAVPWIGVINPATIIILGPMLSKFVDSISEKFNSLQLMITGICIFIAGLMVIAFARTFVMAAVGIIVFSIGEFLTHPNFISYVSKIAPKEKVAMYMGYAFIPTGIGYTIGSVASGFLYTYLSVQMHQPTIFWCIVASTGCFVVAGLLVYNKVFILERAADMVEEGMDAEVLKARGGTRLKGGIWESRLTPIIVIGFIPLFIMVSLLPGELPFYREDESVATTGQDWVLETASIGPITGQSGENTNTVQEVPIGDLNIVNMTFTLTWQDEPPPGVVRYTNTPDEFTLIVETPDGIVEEEGPVQNAAGGAGEVSVTISRSPVDGALTGETASGTYNVTIAMGNAGDSRTNIGIFGFTDSGNSWSLAIDYEFFREKTVEEKKEPKAE